MITKNIKQQIKEHFMKNPSERLRVRQIERKLKLPLPSVIRYVKELQEEEILRSEEIGGAKLYSAKRTSPSFLLEKKLFNLKQIYKSGLIDYLVHELSNPTIVLFGSYSHGQDIEKSDIDIYIEYPTEKKIDLKKFEKILDKEIQLFIFSNIHKVPNKELANNIINGITLNGFIEPIK
jgi:predicted nucleotidyltransferase